MKKILAILVTSMALSISAPAFAATNSVEYLCQNTDMTKLTPAQVESVKSLCAKPEPGADVAVAGVTPDKVRAWGSLGREFSTAVVETARGLGIAANELLFTPVGFMIAFYFMWDMVGGILIGIPLLIALWIAYFRIGWWLMTDNVEYENVPVLWGAFTVKKVKNRTLVTGHNGEGAGYWYFLAGPLSIILSAIIIGVLIF